MIMDMSVNDTCSQKTHWEKNVLCDSEQCSNRLELDLISLLVNFSCELGQIMTIYNFLFGVR